jgi:hypothetical protein
MILDGLDAHPRERLTAKPAGIPARRISAKESAALRFAATEMRRRTAIAITSDMRRNGLDAHRNAPSLSE